MMNGLKMMTTDSEQVLDGTVNREKTLSLCHGFEPSHLPLLFTSVLMGDFSPGCSRIDQCDGQRKERSPDVQPDNSEACR